MTPGTYCLPVWLFFPALKRMAILSAGQRESTRRDLLGRPQTHKRDFVARSSFLILLISWQTDSLWNSEAVLEKSTFRPVYLSLGPYQNFPWPPRENVLDFDQTANNGKCFRGFGFDNRRAWVKFFSSLCSCIDARNCLCRPSPSLQT